MDRNKTKTKENAKDYIACMGLAGSFSHIVARRMHPRGRIVSHTSLDNVGKAAANGECIEGVLPIENTTAGTVQETFDVLLRHDLSIVGERFLPVVHHLLVRKMLPGSTAARLKAIKTIWSHPKAIEQCQTFLESLPNASLIMVRDTAEAARRVAVDRNPEMAAIGSMESAQAHGLRVLVPGIQSSGNNVTRFILVRKKLHAERGNKATLCATLPHVPGSLHRLLGSFAKHRLNLLHIESRPIPEKPWEYRFLIDLDVKGRHRHFHHAIEEARLTALRLDVLGIYDKGVRL